ncbi:MAG: response regulator [Sphingomonadales bacterium]|nr:response regulator [Sphingomonadales bacterium]
MLQTGNSSLANVLIVEDEFLVALELEDILTDAGHKVVGIVPDRAGAQVLAQPPEVALVDLNLRDGPSGPTIAQQLAERFGTIIVYVTANPGQIGKPAPTALGVVQKPFSQHAILAAVALAVSGGTGGDVPPELNLYQRAGE